VCAFLAPDAIPEDLIIDGVTELGPLLAAWKHDTTRLDEAIGMLNSFSLVRRSPEERTISVHRLVQAIQIMDMDELTKRRWAKRTVRAVNEAFPFVEVATWPQCERYLSHARQCATLVDTFILSFYEAARLLNQVALYLYERAQYAEALPLFRRALTIIEKALGPNHPDMATSINNLAYLYDSQGKFEQAEPLYQRSFVIMEKALGPDHPNSRAIRANHARLLEKMKRKKKMSARYDK
jgi:tetratricopeptide (TPR) repeat protein